MNITVTKLILGRGSCEKLQKIQFADPAFKTPGISATVHHTNPYITLVLPVESIFETMDHQPIFPMNSSARALKTSVG